MPLRPQAKTFIGTLAAMAAACFVTSASHWHPRDAVQLSSYLLLATAASTLKITLPGIDGTMSVNFLFILLSVMELSFAETLLIGACAVLVQSLWRRSKSIQPVQFIFNLSQLTVASAATFLVYRLCTSTVLHNTPRCGDVGFRHLLHPQYHGDVACNFAHGKKADLAGMAGMLCMVFSVLPRRCSYSRRPRTTK